MAWCSITLRFDASTKLIGPTFWLGLSRVRVDMAARIADCDGGTAATLVKCDVFDETEVVFVILPAHIIHAPFTGLPFANERTACVVGAVLKCATNGF